MNGGVGGGGDDVAGHHVLRADVDVRQEEGRGHAEGPKDEPGLAVRLAEAGGDVQDGAERVLEVRVGYGGADRIRVGILVPEDVDLIHW